MKTVGSRELKNRLGRYLGLVRRGETIIVTDRGKTVAHLIPPQLKKETAMALKIFLDASKRKGTFGELQGKLKPERSTRSLPKVSPPPEWSSKTVINALSSTLPRSLNVISKKKQGAMP